MEQRPSSEANSGSANQYPAHYGIWFFTMFSIAYTVLPILKHTNPVHILTP